MEKYGRARQATVDNVIWRMRVACWITKGTDTHSEYVMLIAFLRQQMLRERVSVLGLWVHCLCCYAGSNASLLIFPDMFLRIR